MNILFKNIEKNIIFKQGDIVFKSELFPRGFKFYPGLRVPPLYDISEFYYVVSHYAKYMDSNFKMKTVHISKFSYKDVNFFGNW